MREGETTKTVNDYYCDKHWLACEPVMPFRTLWNCPDGHWVQIYRDCTKVPVVIS